MKFGIITYYNDRYKILGDLASGVMFEYCQMYGFDFICSRGDDVYKGRTPLWSKIPLLLENLPNYDWLMWIDSDAAPANFEINALDFIDEDYDLILAEEHHHDGSAINTGVMWIKNTEMMGDLLKHTWQQEQCINHPWGEQQGMIETIEKYPHYNDRIKKLDIHPINVKPDDFGENDFICHVAGGPANPDMKASALMRTLNSNRNPYAQSY